MDPDQIVVRKEGQMIATSDTCHVTMIGNADGNFNQQQRNDGA